METDRPDPSEFPSEFVPSQVPGGKFEIPNVFMSLDGCSLSTDDLVELGKGRYKIKLTTEAEEKVNASRALIDSIVKENRVVYGITTGFGKFARTVIEKGKTGTRKGISLCSNAEIFTEKLKELQENLIRSHAAGVGKALTPEKTRMLLALR